MTAVRWELALDDARVMAELADRIDEAAYRAGEHVLDESNRHVPHEDGDLERSGRVSPPESGAVAIYYDTPYAVRQHEELDYQHDAGRTAKYLENACNSQRRTVARILADGLRL